MNDNNIVRKLAYWKLEKIPQTQTPFMTNQATVTKVSAREGNAESQKKRLARRKKLRIESKSNTRDREVNQNK